MHRTVRRIRRSNWLPRPACVAAVGVALALAVAAPAAAARPTRTVVDGHDHLLAADQTGCGFAVYVAIAPGGRIVTTEYSDGAIVTDEYEVRTLTNVSNGKTFVQHAAWHDVEWFDPATGIIRGITNGRQAAGFFPGDVSPYGGTVQAPGLGVEFVGTQWYTYDTTIGRLTAFAYQGKPITDICALLS